jgi:hypothetical protein
MPTMLRTVESGIDNIRNALTVIGCAIYIETKNIEPYLSG